MPQQTSPNQNLNLPNQQNQGVNNPLNPVQQPSLVHYKELFFKPLILFLSLTN